MNSRTYGFWKVFTAVLFFLCMIVAYFSSFGNIDTMERSPEDNLMLFGFGAVAVFCIIANVYIYMIEKKRRK